MPWYVYALATMVFAAAAALFHKRALGQVHALEFSAALSLASLVVLLPFLDLIDFASVSWPAFGIITISTLFGAGSFLLVTKAMRHLEVSTVSPWLALEPVVVAVLGIVLLGENLTWPQALGVALCTVGVFVLQHSLADPGLKGSFWKSPYVRMILLAVVCYSFAVIGDRLALGYYGVQPLAYLVVTEIELAAIFIALLFMRFDGWAGITHAYRIAGWFIVGAAILTVAHRFAHAEAVSLASAALITPIKRSAVLLVTAIGGELFHEHQLGRKIFASVIILFGVVLTIL